MVTNAERLQVSLAAEKWVHTHTHLVTVKPFDVLQLCSLKITNFDLSLHFLFAEP